MVLKLKCLKDLNWKTFAVLASTLLPLQVFAEVEVYLTTQDHENRLSRKEPLEIIAEKDPNILDFIQVKPETKFQTMEGFGASFTEASAHLINQYLNDEQRNELMRKLFDPTAGIGMSFLRQTIGGSDFSRTNYTYLDAAPADGSDLRGFSIERDLQDIIPIVSKAIKINPQTKVMASPWSAPAWMKRNNSLFGGKLRDPEGYGIYAKYLVRYIEEYKKHNIPIFAITPQNEPMHQAAYMSMKMEWWEQFNFIFYHLFPEFEKNQISSKILAFDHNWNLDWYPRSLVENNNQAIIPKIGGVAFHCYKGDPSAMGEFHDLYPSIDIYLTECSDHGKEEKVNIEWFVSKLLIKSVRNWAKTIVRWNIALDENHGPRVIEANCENCRGLVEINSQTHEVKYLRDYYALGHASKFVFPGAYRIESDQTEKIETVAFENPDKSLVLIAHNTSSKSKTFQVDTNGSIFTYTLPGHAVVTFRWNTEVLKERINNTFKFYLGRDAERQDYSHHIVNFRKHGDFSLIVEEIKSHAKLVKFIKDNFQHFLGRQSNEKEIEVYRKEFYLDHHFDRVRKVIAHLPDARRR